MRKKEEEEEETWRTEIRGRKEREASTLPGQQMLVSSPQRRRNRTRDRQSPHVGPEPGPGGGTVRSIREEGDLLRAEPGEEKSQRNAHQRLTVLCPWNPVLHGPR